MENKAEATTADEETGARETPEMTEKETEPSILAGETETPVGDGQEKTPGAACGEAEGRRSDAGAEAVDRVKALEAKLAESEAALKSANDRYLRSMAELENFRKRTARETEEFRKYANTALVQKLLPALDNMERAMDSAGAPEAAASAIVDGLRITLADIVKIFAEFHVRPVEAEGKVFDPVYHMAVAHEETDAADPDTVIRVFQKGYIMHDRLIRPAMVAVAKARTVPAGQDGNSISE